MHTFNCFSLAEIIKRGAFDSRYQIRYPDEDNQHNGSLVQINKEDMIYDDGDCQLIHIRIEKETDDLE